MAKKSQAAAPEPQEATPPTLVFGFDVSEFLRRVGVDLAQIETQANNWAAAHPGQALPLEVALAFVKAEFGEAQVGAALKLVAAGLVDLVQTGKGPVQHAGSELV